MPTVKFRHGAQGPDGDAEMAISGSFSLKDHFFVFKSPAETWSDYGGIKAGNQ